MARRASRHRACALRPATPVIITAYFTETSATSKSTNLMYELFISQHGISRRSAASINFYNTQNTDRLCYIKHEYFMMHCSFVVNKLVKLLQRLNTSEFWRFYSLFISQSQSEFFKFAVSGLRNEIVRFSETSLLNGLLIGLAYVEDAGSLNSN